MPTTDAVITYGWLFLAFYLVVIAGLGYWGWKRTGTQDDYATARGGFGFLALGFAYAATVASGSTFMGIPGMAYDMGFKAGYYALIYPIGAYLGIMLVARITKKVGDEAGSQSIPDFLGDRFKSPVLRLMASLVALFLLFYVMSQIVAAGWMFDTILGLDYTVGIWAAAGMLLLYLTLGGSHADIITDAVQGAIMVGITILIFAMFLTGWGFDGGVSAVNANLDSSQQWDTHTDSDNPIFANWWVIFLLFVGHIGFTAQPHLGNKFFAIKGTQYMKKFFLVAAVAGMTLPLMFLGGVLGAAQGIEITDPDAIIPVLFIETLPAVLAAFLGVAILSAIISTADGLIISVAQIFANDLYRKTYVPWKGGDPSSPAVNQRALLISRVATVVVTIVAVAAVMTPPQYLSVFMWIGIGGIISAYSGPYFVGSLDESTSKKAAIIGFVAGFAVYAVIHLGPQMGLYDSIAGFSLFPYSENPYASSGIGFIVSCVSTYLGSKFTEPMAVEDRNEVFRGTTELSDGGRVESDD
ncbi:sodium:pantothenate symporter [Natronococcus amylolyticus DSM 10524]|uniref:Sodium:pantothenate symporter n=1 Tax=Natronococcus amylolyticus DSM 10524 TaxID=1227497 RepID=L9X0Z1_9EURY|nr:sodium:solute symporter family protein [Natronococcus amylolyticus]ELY55390.1 sodium:pantothenate symporter [Natronococcus amylolyticus DSM 10524]